MTMTTSHVGPVPVELPQNKGLIADSGAPGSDQGPMSQQDAADCHGHEMHPQEFVRLVGCHESRHRAEDHLH